MNRRRDSPNLSALRQGSSVVEQGTHKPLVGSSTLPPGTKFSRQISAMERWLSGRKQRFAKSESHFLQEFARILTTPQSLINKGFAANRLFSRVLTNRPKLGRGLTFLTYLFFAGVGMARGPIVRNPTGVSQKSHRHLWLGPPSGRVKAESI